MPKYIAPGAAYTSRLSLGYPAVLTETMSA